MTLSPSLKRKELETSATRDPLALAMLAAWLNVRPDQIPEVNRAHTCEATMIAWRRVGRAAVAYVNEHPG